MHNFKQFLDYCESFYSPEHPDCLYPIDGLTRGELALAILNYLDLCAEDENVNWGDGDSLDRERVRDFVIERRAIDYNRIQKILAIEDAKNPVRGLNFTGGQ
tara:strand:+ start:190 stop:495 length:306 start_codon:yes stop_codon:yes gene_type:complete